MFGMLGIKFYGNREIAKVADHQDKLNRNFSEILFIHLIFTLISIILYVFYVIKYSEYYFYALIQGLVVISGFFDVSWLFFGLEKFKESVLRSSFVKILSVVCIFAFVKDRHDFNIYILIMSSSLLLSQLILCVQAKKYVSFVKFNLKDSYRHISPLFVLFIPVLALSLFKYMDKIMLGAWSTKVELGFYENADKVINIPLSIIFSVGSVMLPKMTKLISSGDDLFAQYYMRITIKYLVGLSFAMTCGLIGISCVFSYVFWGAAFSKSGTIISLLALSLPFSTLANIIRNQDMIPKKRDKYYTYSIINGAIVNIIVNSLTIPHLQAFGVALGTIAAEVTVCLSEIWFVRKELDYFKSVLQSLVFIPASILMCISVYTIGLTLGTSILTLVLQIIFGSLFLLIFSYISLFLFRDKDLKMITEGFDNLLKKAKQ